ncbi:MAG: hypothetical protein V4558_13330 [Gemmatimonadota bacterium]
MNPDRLARRYAVGGLPVILVLGLAAACSSETATNPSRHFIIDSVGVAIITSNAPELADSLAYRVDSVPFLNLDGKEGGRQGFAGALLATRSQIGWIVAADLSSRQIYFYGGEGRLIRVVGGEGTGPGEFRAINFVGTLPGDSIIVSDPALHRLTVLDAGGTVRRTALLPEAGPGAPFAVNGTFRDGVLLATTFFPAGWQPRPGPHRDTMPMVTLRADGTLRSTVGAFPGPDGVVFVDPGEVVRTARTPYGRVTRQSIWDTLLAVGVGDRYEISFYARDGRVVRQLRWKHQPVPVSGDDYRTYVRERDEAFPLEPAGRTEFYRELREMRFPKVQPPYDLILTRGNGELWVRAYVGPYLRKKPSLWSVFDRNGVWRCDLTIPVGVEPKYISDDAVLGTWQDEDESYHLGLYRLRTGQ